MFPVVEPAKHARRSYGGVVVAALLIAISCSATGSANAATFVKPASLDVVILGDSYSAGNGARNSQGNRDYYGAAGCYRSHSTWGEQYVASLRAKGYAVRLVNRACSGAKTADIVNDNYMDSAFITLQVTGANGMRDDRAFIAELQSGGSCVTKDPTDEVYTPKVSNVKFTSGGNATVTFECQRSLRAQIAAVNDSTDLVLMTIGGNDLGFSNIVKDCFALVLPGPANCRSDVDNAKSKLAAVQTRTYDLLTMLHARMHAGAKVALIAYPYIEERDGYTIKALWGSSYSAGKEIRAAGRMGDQVQFAAVQQANTATGTDFAAYVGDVKKRFDGHEPDGEVFRMNTDRWMYELGETDVAAEWYHLNPKGQAAIKEALVANGIFGVMQPSTFRSALHVD